MLSQNLIGKNDQSVVYASRLLNTTQHNYSITHRKALAMAFALHKFKNYLLGNKFIFYVDHMALVYLVNQPQVSGRIVRWLLSFIEYNFIVVYMLGKTHIVTNLLSRLPNITKPIGVPNQTTYANLFYIEPK
jgi:hypothetical protein